MEDDIKAVGLSAMVDFTELVAAVVATTTSSAFTLRFAREQPDEMTSLRQSLFRLIDIFSSFCQRVGQPYSDSLVDRQLTSRASPNHRPTRTHTSPNSA